MRFSTLACVAAVMAAAACTDADPRPTAPVPDRPPTVLGVYEVTLSGLGTSQMRSSVVPVPAGPSASLDPVTGGVTLEMVTTGGFTDGSRTAGGQRYASASYRLRNNAGRALSNVTLLMVSRTSSIPGTAMSSVTRFDGSAADPAIAPTIVPTGAVAQRSDLSGLRVLHPDVLQVFTEDEVAAIPRPAGVLDVYPVGFVVRNASSEATSRTLPVPASANQFDGVITFSVRIPLQASSTLDVYNLTFHVMVIEDTETRVTESIEEGQDTAGVRAVRERAAALGATSVTVLAGSPAAGPDAPDYPGQRQICSVRTSGTAASPTSLITRPGGYTRLALYFPGESVSACGANFRSGTAPAPEAGTPYPVTVRAMDRYGNVMTSAVDTVALSRVSGPAATFGPPAPLVSGQAVIDVTYQSTGTSVLRASGARVRGERTLGVPGGATVGIVAGGEQVGMAGGAVAVPPSVVVRDSMGVPLAGVPVTFTVTNGGGSVSGGVVTTDGSGVATVGGWTLGATAGSNTLSATTPRAETGALFSAGGCSGGGSGYRLTLCFMTPLTPAQRAAVDSAAARWTSVVTGELADVQLSLGAGSCGTGSPAVSLTVDDLMIVVRADAIDGVGGVVGTAGPCASRLLGLPALGVMRFDAADLAAMEAGGTLHNVVRHEMGHVLGIGTRWTAFGLLANASPIGGTPLDTYFSGLNAITGFNLAGGTLYTAGMKVPVENTGSTGVVNMHWRKSVLANELMTSPVSAGSMPLSQVTVRSLADLGYVVDPSAADPFFLTLSLRAGAEGLVSLGNDVYAGPHHVVGESRARSRAP